MDGLDLRRRRHLHGRRRALPRHPLHLNAARHRAETRHGRRPDDAAEAPVPTRRGGRAPATPRPRREDPPPRRPQRGGVRDAGRSRPAGPSRRFTSRTSTSSRTPTPRSRRCRATATWWCSARRAAPPRWSRGCCRRRASPRRNIRGGMIAYGVYLEPVRVPLAAGEAARFELWQVNRRGKACLSYVIVSGGEAVVVDPSRHVEWYEGFAAERGARIVRVLDTHVHADHVSGGPALARKLGVPYFVAAGEGFELRQPVTPLADGQQVRLGGEKGVSIEVRVLEHPGPHAGLDLVPRGRHVPPHRRHALRRERRPTRPRRPRGRVGARPLRHAEAAARRPARRDPRPARPLRGHRRDLAGGRRLGPARRPPAHRPRDADRHGRRVRRGGAGRGEGPAAGLRGDHPGEPGRPGQPRRRSPSGSSARTSAPPPREGGAGRRIPTTGPTPPFGKERPRWPSRSST